MTVATSVIPGFAAWTAKAAVLFLYIEMFGIKVFIRVVSYTTLTITFLFNLILTACIATVCSPTQQEALIVLPKCQQIASQGGIATGVIALVTNIIVLVLPLPVIFHLRLSLAKRIGLAAVFLSGIL